MSVFPRLSPRLQETIVARLGWSSLRPVQDEAGEALLDGLNAIVLAPTAGGKTEAAVFPTLSALMDDPPRSVGALYIAPLKALLNNQADRLGLYTEMVGLRRFVWHGDTPNNERKSFLGDPAELLMTTPESLEVMMVSRRVDEHALFRDVRTVIVDEIHALAGTDRGAHLMSIIERVARLSRHDLQRVGLSATVGNPEAILSWLTGTSAREGRVVDPPRKPSRKQLLVVHRPLLPELAAKAVHMAKGRKSLFFCRSRATTEAVAEMLRRAGTSVFVHHSAVSKEERLRAEEQFHLGGDACIVCTSTLELGIDIGDLDQVLQAEAPDTVSSFLQRMGRTGRRPGQAANTTFLCETSEGVLQAIAIVEMAKSGWVEAVKVNDRCWPVLIHQLLAMSLAKGGVTPNEAWEQLSVVPDFRGISRDEYDRLLHWLRGKQAFDFASGRLVIGPEAEKQFGRRNFMELFAVFFSPESYTVQTLNGEPIGSLTQEFVDRLVDDVSTFLLSGRAWAVMRVQHEDRRIIVQPAPRGREPTWGGILPQFLGYDISQRILGVLTGEEEPPYLEESAQKQLADQRGAMRSILEPGVGGLEVEHGEIRWWTFAGGRINTTLRYALAETGADWKIVPNNFFIRIVHADLDRAAFDGARRTLQDRSFWEDEGRWAGIAEALPNYRLSKFQSLMPPWVVQEVVAEYLLDLEGTRQWLAGEGEGGPRFKP